MQRILGIDLGTTNSVCAYVYRGEPQILNNAANEESTSSVVSVGKRGELLVGNTARGRAKRDPSSVIYSVKRFMGRRFADRDVQDVLARKALPYQVTEADDGDVNVWLGGRAYTPTEVSSLILGRLKAEAEDRAKCEFPRAVITVPAYFGERQVAATLEAGRMAGFNVLKVFDEPTAAALAYGFIRENPDDDQTVVVFDLGGGTFDVSVLLMVGSILEVQCVEGDNLLGGDDFDELLAGMVAARIKEQDGVDVSEDRTVTFEMIKEAELTKIRLSAQLDTEFLGSSLGRLGISPEIDVTREEFVALVRDKVDGAVRLVEKAVAGAHLTLDDVSHVLLVGGSTAVPYVQERLTELFGAERIRKDINPMRSVALGAAIQGNLQHSITCLSCAAESPIEADDCGSCGTSLTPPVKRACPACFRYSDEGTATCGRCGAALDGSGTVGSGTGGSGAVDGSGAPAGSAGLPGIGIGTPPVVSTPPATCPTCGNALPRAGFECPACTDPLVAGLACAVCRTVIPPGAKECPGCGQVVDQPGGVTAQDIGIELHGGAMAPVLRKGTNFPTQEMVPRDFETVVTGQPRLEIVVYEGADPVAARNELLGYLTLTLPPELPKGSPVSVSFGYDGSRNLTLSVNVRAIGSERKVELRRERLDPKLIQQVDARRGEVETFVHRWRDELTEAEATMLDLTTSELEAVVNGESADRAAADALMRRSEQQLALVRTARSNDAYISNFVYFTGRFMTDEQRSGFEFYVERIEEARRRADWEQANTVAEQAKADIREFDPELRMVTFCRESALQGMLSPALTNQVQDAVRRFDESHDRNDAAGRRAALQSLQGVLDDVQRETGSFTRDVDIVAKPRLAGS